MIVLLQTAFRVNCSQVLVRGFPEQLTLIVKTAFHLLVEAVSWDVVVEVLVALLIRHLITGSAVARSEALESFLNLGSQTIIVLVAFLVS